MLLYNGKVYKLIAIWAHVGNRLRNLAYDYYNKDYYSIAGKIFKVKKIKLI